MQHLHFIFIKTILFSRCLNKRKWQNDQEKDVGYVTQEELVLDLEQDSHTSKAQNLAA